MPADSGNKTFSCYLPVCLLFSTEMSTTEEKKKKRKQDHRQSLNEMTHPAPNGLVIIQKCKEIQERKKRIIIIII